MRRVFLVFCLLTVAFASNAQKVYFVYLQTETGDPFFVRMGDKLYNSSSPGYLILSNLIDSTYKFKVGFPGKSFDLDFSTNLNSRDHGYLIKDFGDKGWGLFDLQSLNVQMSSSGSKGTATITDDPNVRVNSFTDMLSKATDDPSLKQNVILVKGGDKKPEVIETVQREERKSEGVEAVIKEGKKPEQIGSSIKTPAETKIVFENKDPKTSVAEKDSSVKTGQVYRRSHVTRLSGTTTSDGIEYVFVDESQDGTRDTIRVLVPAEQKSQLVKEEAKPDSTKTAEKLPDVRDTARAIHRSETKDQAKKWNIFTRSKDTSSGKQGAEAKNDGVKKLWPFGKARNDSAQTKGCREVAVNDDFLKLRRRMAAKTNDDGMLDEAKKYFRVKCFTTEQIRNLSSMFLSNAGKFDFFKVARGYIADKENFTTLQSELKDAYYINQFKALASN